MTCAKRRKLDWEPIWGKVDAFELGFEEQVGSEW